MQKDISIIIPVCNDASTIGETIDKVLDFFELEKLDGEIIIVNDGGQRNGVEIVKEKMFDSDKIRLIDRQINKGKGFSVREGVMMAEGKTIFYTDADLPYGTEYMALMRKKLVNGESDLILANRDMAGEGGMKKAPFTRKITHILYSIFVGALVVKFSDTQAGLKGMTKELGKSIVSQLVIDGFAFDVELIFLAKKMGYKIGEVPVVLKHSGKSNLKIIFDSPRMIKDILKIVWRYRIGFYKNK